LLSAGRWEEALGANGFTEVLALPGPEEVTSVFGQHVILARAPLAPVLSDQALQHVVTDAALAPTAAQFAAQNGVGELAPIVEALNLALPNERREILVDFTRKAVARVLRTGDPQRIGRDQRLLDLGFDSLMAVELRNVLKQGAGLSQKLPATLVFDYPTVAGLATYLDRLMSAEAPSSDAAQPPSTQSLTDLSPILTTNAAEIAEMTDAEAEALLLKRLEEINGNG
jgi:acyl carrier protein